MWIRRQYRCLRDGHCSSHQHWRWAIGANGDGIPDATEVKTLAELGITSVGLSTGDPAEASTTLNGNQATATGTFTRLDGRAARLGRMRGMRLGPGDARRALARRRGV